jgi:DNA-directed RNA polymerase subunit L
VGEDHTLLNLLRKVLWDVPGVILAAYRKEHPMLGNPIFVVQTKGKTKPEKALKDAAKKITGMAKEFGLEFEKALPKK